MRIAHASLAFIVLATASVAGSQETAKPGMQHMAGMKHDAPVARPTQGGQAAFAAIGEIVKLLDADSATDWSTVNLEALRQHFIDMDLVTLRSRVRETPTEGGVVLAVTGDAQVAPAIRRMLGAHAKMLNEMTTYHAVASEITDGMRLTVTARNANAARDVTRLRGLGFIGLMTEGEHHSAHHLMIARGMGAHAHDMK